MTTPQEPTQMTEREMLELAALAAGLSIDKSAYNGGGHGNTGFDISGNAVLDWHNSKTWNPLTDDGDALRLAVKLRMFLDLESCNAASSANHAPVWFGGGEDEHAGIDHDECDPCAATRLAITRAAAEIGRQMKVKQ